MRRKIKLYSWRYFKDNHHITCTGHVSRYLTSLRSSYLTKEIVDERIYNVVPSFPGPYTIITDDKMWYGWTRNREKISYDDDDRIVFSWMIEEVITEESHPEYFV